MSNLEVYKFNDWFLHWLVQLFEGVLSDDINLTNDALKEIQRGYEWVEDIHPQLVNLSLKYVSLIQLYQIQASQPSLHADRAMSTSWLGAVHPIESIDFAELERKLAERRRITDESIARER